MRWSLGTSLDGALPELFLHKVNDLPWLMLTALVIPICRIKIMKNVKVTYV